MNSRFSTKRFGNPGGLGALDRKALKGAAYQDDVLLSLHHHHLPSTEEKASGLLPHFDKNTWIDLDLRL